MSKISSRRALAENLIMTCTAFWMQGSFLECKPSPLDYDIIQSQLENYIKGVFLPVLAQSFTYFPSCHYVSVCSDILCAHCDITWPLSDFPCYEETPKVCCDHSHWSVISSSDHFFYASFFRGQGMFLCIIVSLYAC